MRPGGSTSRMIENAVSDLPLPDSPTRPSVSPGAIEKLTSRTAGVNRPFTSKPVVRCSTARSGASDIDVGVLPEHRAHRVRDLADRGMRLDRLNDRRDEVVGAACGGAHRVERRSPGALVALRPHAAEARDLAGFDLRVDPQHLDLLRVGRGELVDP